MQIVRYLDKDGIQHNYRQPSSFVEEIELFLENAWAFFLSQRELFRGYWHWFPISVLVAILAVGIIMAWEFVPSFNSGL